MKSLEEFRDMLRKAMEQESETKHHNEVVEAVYKRLAEQVGDVELPPNVLQSEVSKELQKIAREVVKSEEDARNLQEGAGNAQGRRPKRPRGSP